MGVHAAKTLFDLLDNFGYVKFCSEEGIFIERGEDGLISAYYTHDEPVFEGRLIWDAYETLKEM